VGGGIREQLTFGSALGSDVDIEIYSDIICPWCYIGKRRLELALRSYDGETTLHYRPYQLNPAPMPKPILTTEFLARSYGIDSARVRSMMAVATTAAAGVGLTFDQDRALIVNTFEAHRLVWFAGTQGRQAEMVDALHRAHFADGVDLSSHPALALLAESVDVKGADEFLASDASTTEVRNLIETARGLGVTSVPTFVLAGKYAITGAQEPETLRAALDKVRQRESIDS
jgi:predicted DsbA family dithiol-disulfide isomerase